MSTRERRGSFSYLPGNCGLPSPPWIQVTNRFKMVRPNTMCGVNDEGYELWAIPARRDDVCLQTRCIRYKPA